MARGAPPLQRRAAHLGPERRRPQILDVSLRVFRRHGYEATTIEMIARAARVTRPVVYACYPNKKELFGALLDREERRLLGQILQNLPTPAPDDPEGMLIEGFTAILRTAALAPDSWGVIFLHEYSSPAMAERVERAREQLRSHLAELAKPVLAGGGVEDPGGRLSSLVAHLLLGNAEAGTRLMLTGEEWKPDDLGQLLGRMIAPALQVLKHQGSAGRDPSAA